MFQSYHLGPIEGTVRNMADQNLLPAMPLTMEGSWILHQMVRFDWPVWRGLTKAERDDLASEAARLLTSIGAGNTGLYSLVGHKGDFLLVHFRKTFDELNDAEVALAKIRLGDYMEVDHSYLSVVELGLYESSVKTYQALAEQALQPHTEEWDKAIAETLDRQRTAMATRLYPEIPPAKYACFYPMNRLRGEIKNWYMLPIQERQRQMHDHGLVGRRYQGEVRQIISGSIGLDDWEWGVTLFAEDPLVFKKLIYEMRFDEVSAVYAEFGEFFTGIRRDPAELGALLKV
jgi:hydrogen peroxide-dependent heme synthase